MIFIFYKNYCAKNVLYPEGPINNIGSLSVVRLIWNESSSDKEVNFIIGFSSTFSLSAVIKIWL